MPEKLNRDRQEELNQNRHNDSNEDPENELTDESMSQDQGSPAVVDTQDHRNVDTPALGSEDTQDRRNVDTLDPGNVDTRDYQSEPIQDPQSDRDRVEQKERTDAWRAAIDQLTRFLDEASINYSLKGAAALVVVGQAPPRNEQLECAFQWDQLKEAHQLFEPYQTSAVSQSDEGAFFEVSLGGVSTRFFCKWNQVIVTEPSRLAYSFMGKTVYAEAPTYILKNRTPLNAVYQVAQHYLDALQKQNTEMSRTAWNTGTYEAWVNRFGPPDQLGPELRESPDRKLTPIKKYIGDLLGKKVLNLMGSNGIKAVAMACKGADVTVIDLSEESARYAGQLAKTAGVSLQYIVGDVLSQEEVQLEEGQADVIVMERGILHYFVDLLPLMTRVSSWLAEGGRFVLQDFHPISTKLIQSKGKKHLANGNYFDPSIYPTPVATTKYSDQQETAYVHQRRWTLGEVVTGAAEAGLRIIQLDEEPNEKRNDIGIPKMFTLVAEK